MANQNNFEDALFQYTDKLGQGKVYKGHFTHETESPWPLYSKHSHYTK